MRLPALWPHLLGAAALIAALFVAVPLLAMRLGDARSAEPGGSVVVAALPQSERPTPLDADTNLPDLLAADVLVGDNPTEGMTAPATRTDALGNPVGGTVSAPTPKTISVSPRASEGLRPVDPTLSRDGPFGRVPAPNAAGLSPLDAYKRPATPVGNRKPVALVVGGLGINATLTRRAIDELPPAVTLSFAAHANDLQAQIDRARAAGHEVLLELPMESAGFDPGEPGADLALRVDTGVRSNRRNLARLLSRAQGYAGVINYNGDRVLTRSDVAAPLLGDLKEAGLGVVVDGSFSAPTLQALASSTNVPFVTGFGLIDPEADRGVIDRRLDALSASASGGGAALGVGFAYPETIDALKGWTATLGSDGLALVPATALLQ